MLNSDNSAPLTRISRFQRQEKRSLKKTHKSSHSLLNLENNLRIVKRTLSGSIDSSGNRKRNFNTDPQEKQDKHSESIEIIIQNEIDEFFKRIFTRNSLSNSRIGEIFLSFQKKIDFTKKNRALCKYFLSCFGEKTSEYVRIEVEENIMSDPIYIDLKEKFLEMNCEISSSVNCKNAAKIRKIKFVDFYRANKQNINKILKRLIELFDSFKKYSSMLEELITEHLRIANDVQMMTIENIQKEEFANMIIREGFISEIISELIDKNDCTSQDIPEMIRENIINIKEEIHNLHFQIIKFKSEDVMCGKTHESEEISESESPEREENSPQLKINKLGLDELVEFIERSEDDSPSKRKKNRRKKNKKKETKEKVDFNVNSLNVDEKRGCYYEIENSDKEIEEFVKKLKECSQHANKIIKIKPIMSSEWSLSILRGLKN